MRYVPGITGELCLGGGGGGGHVLWWKKWQSVCPDMACVVLAMSHLRMEPEEKDASSRRAAYPTRWPSKSLGEAGGCTSCPRHADYEVRVPTEYIRTTSPMQVGSPNGALACGAGAGGGLVYSFECVICQVPGSNERTTNYTVRRQAGKWCVRGEVARACECEHFLSSHSYARRRLSKTIKRMSVASGGPPGRQPFVRCRPRSKGSESPGRPPTRQRMRRPQLPSARRRRHQHLSQGSWQRTAGARCDNVTFRPAGAGPLMRATGLERPAQPSVCETRVPYTCPCRGGPAVGAAGSRYSVPWVAAASAWCPADLLPQPGTSTDAANQPPASAGALVVWAEKHWGSIALASRVPCGRQSHGSGADCWARSPVSTENSPGFLSGRVHLLPTIPLTLSSLVRLVFIPLRSPPRPSPLCSPSSASARLPTAIEPCEFRLPIGPSSPAR